jgi:hypothetical protein
MPVKFKKSYSGKWKQPVLNELNRFWKTNHYPPTLRDLMEVTGISSTSVCRFVLLGLDDVRLTEFGHPIPKWVDNMFDAITDRILK